MSSNSMETTQRWSGATYLEELSEVLRGKSHWSHGLVYTEQYGNGLDAQTPRKKEPIYLTVYKSNLIVLKYFTQICQTVVIKPGSNRF